MVQHDKYTPCGQHKRAAQRAALRCIFDFVLCDGRNGGHSQNDGTQHDAVEAEELEVVAFDVIHQEADGSQADHKSNHTAHHENGHFGVMLGAERFQLVDVQDLHAADLFAHFVGGVIKGGDQLVTIGVGGDKTAHGLA